jgi:hypothetical protein
MPIDDLMLDPGPTIYYNDEFRRVLEDHMTVLRTSAGTRIIDIDAGTAYKFEADFYGLLVQLNVPLHLHWVVLRVNNMTNPSEFKVPRTEGIELRIPDPNAIGQILQSHRTTRKIIT